MMTGAVASITLAIVAIILAVTTITTGRSFAPWMPSSVRIARRGLAFIKPRPEMRFVDLGCGDGRMVLLAAREFGLNAFGYERAPLPYLLAKIRMLCFRSAPVTIRRTDLFTVDLASYDIVYIYGLPDAINQKLSPKLARELRPGSWILSYNFSLREKKPRHVIKDKWRTLFIYHV